MSTITNLEKTSTGAASLTIINDNFDNLNTDKLEKSGGIMTGELSWNTVAALGLKIQSLTTAQRNVLTPANGHIIYNTTTTQFEVYENGAWVSLRGVAVDASTIAKGITKLSVAPAEATNPIAVGDNDSRLPTQGENDALAGTSGTPSGTNKYVTNDDTTTTASAGKLIRGKSVTGKLDESVCQTTDANITDLTDGGETTLHSHAGIGAVVSDNLKASADTVRSGSSASYAKIKEIKISSIPAGGTIRIKFDLRNSYNPVGNPVYGKIYKNGVAAGTERSLTDGTFTTFSEDIAVSPLDLIQLYAKNDGSAATYEVRNFRLYYDKAAIQETTVITD